jgi:carbonic anhydrase
MSQLPAGRTTPAEALEALLDGNLRFVEGRRAHPNQNADRRTEVSESQAPFAIVFGCSDSRVAAEIVFDQGLGDLFVIRTAGHVVDTGVLGSLEFAVDLLRVPLLLVLGHDRCGAVAAAVKAVDSGTMPPGFIRDLVERVTPAVMASRAAGRLGLDDAEAEHVRQTCRLLVERSPVLARAVAEGRCAVAGTVYDLADGRVRILT